MGLSLALIPPHGSKDWDALTNFHMVVPSMIHGQQDLEYWKSLSEDKEQEHRIILDNGAAEGKFINNESLLNLYQEIGAHTIVAPDTIKDADATHKSIQVFLDDYYHDRMKVSANRVIVVPQGVDDIGWIMSFLHLWDSYREYYRDTHIIYGIPKWLGNRRRLVQIVSSLTSERAHVHLLGMSVLHELEWLRDRHFVRDYRIIGLDTSMPFKVGAPPGNMTLSAPYEGYFEPRDLTAVEHHGFNTAVINFLSNIAWER